MPKDLQKFVNPKFVRTVPLGLMRRLLDRHSSAMPWFDFKVFDGEPQIARETLSRFFLHDDGQPSGLIADLHRIAEVGTSQGLETLIQQARRHSVALVLRPGRDIAREDPKHVALTAFLEHSAVFNAASDNLSYYRGRMIAEFVGAEPGLEAMLDDATEAGFKQAVGQLYKEDLRGDYCRLSKYADGDELGLIVTHGAHVTTTPVVRDSGEGVLCYRPTAQARLRNCARDGRLKIGGVTKTRREGVAECFAAAFLARKGFFRWAEAQKLYSLRSVEQDWKRFRIAFGHDPLIAAVRVVEAQVDRMKLDLVGAPLRPEWSISVTEKEGCALTRLRQFLPDLDFTSGAWRLSRIVLRAEMRAGKPSEVTVSIRPPSEATFPRQRFEAQIMELLRRNGFRSDQSADRVPLAAE